MTEERAAFIDGLVSQWHNDKAPMSLMDFLKKHGVSEDEWRVHFIGGIGRSQLSQPNDGPMDNARLQQWQIASAKSKKMS